MTDLEPLDDPAPRESAFTAAPFAWKNIPLHPLAIAREGDWLVHCRRLGLPPLHDAIQHGETFLGHALRLIWFCAHDPSAWLAIWMKGGEAAPVLLEKSISAWADLHVQPGDQVALLRLALDIYDRAHSTRAQLLDAGEGDPEGNASGPSSKLNTSASSHGPAPDSSPSTTSAMGSLKSAAGPMSTPTAAPTAEPSSGPAPPPDRSTN